MSDQSLAQLLKEARDFSDYQKVEARIVSLVQDRVLGLTLATLKDINGLNEKIAEFETRLAKLERIIAGEDTPEDVTDQVFARTVGVQEVKPMTPRPPTRPGDEFPTPVADEELERSRQRSRASKLVEQFHAGELGAIPPSKAVRVDSLPVGARCWGEATVQQDRDIDGDVYLEPVVANPDGYHFWLDSATLVLPAEPSAKEYNGGMATLLPWEIEAQRIHAAEKPIAEPSGTAPNREVTIPRNDTGNSGSRTSPPAPIQLRVGHRYKRADGSEAECIRDNRNDIRCDTGNAFTCRDKNGVHLGYFANGRRWSTISDTRDIIEDLGPVAERASNA